MNIDQFLDRRYDKDHYNCGHFVAEVYEELTKDDIFDICQEFEKGSRGNFVTMLRERVKLEHPVTPCVVIMKAEGIVPHAGVFVDGKVLHLSDNGPVLQHLGVLQLHYRLSFYK